jgi:7-carboxy-7-deazaguanine synthase
LSLKVNEIFHSIQGESSYAGRPCTFVRLTGCNLRCSYCDTTYAYSEGTDYSIEEVVQRAALYKCPLVEITGGEPLIQVETPALIGQLLSEGYRVLLETNGSQDIGRVDPRCVKIVDIKCPSSGQAKENDLENLTKLTGKDEVKFVIGDREDYEFAKELLGVHNLKGNPVHFSPVFRTLAPRTLAEWILSDRLDVRLHLQLHKYIWDPNQRGV